MAADTDPQQVRAAVAAVGPWLAGEPDDTGGTGEPDRATLARAVRLSLRGLPEIAPGRSVEVRVPPFAAVQCVPGPRHTRGTPPNVIETDPRTWLELATGAATWDEAVRTGRLRASGSRAGEVAALLPLA